MKKIISKAEFKTYLVSAYPISGDDFDRIIEEFNGFYDVTLNDYIQNRHLELKSDEKKNEEIYELLIEEIKGMRFKAPGLTTRQVRRIIYG